MNIQSKDINQIIEFGLEQYSGKKKIQDYCYEFKRVLASAQVVCNMVCASARSNP
jgi:hypothetical protein